MPKASDQALKKRIYRLEQLASIASMYYEQEMTQEEIADKFFISRSRISRLLKLAHKNGVVDIRIRHFADRSYELENLLKRSFHLKDAIVAVTDGMEYAQTLTQLGYFAAEYIDANIQTARTFGFSWGKSIGQTVDQLKGANLPDLELVQVIGGIVAQNPLIDIAGITQKVMQKYRGKPYYLNAPLFVDDEQAARVMRAQPIIAEALEKAEKADLILTGIGAIEQTNLQFLWKGFNAQELFNQLTHANAAGFICAQAFDIKGQPISGNFNNHVIGIPLDKLKKVKTVVAVSGGKGKAQAVMGALRGGYVDVLVTDINCVKEIFRLDRSFFDIKPSDETLTALSSNKGKV